MKKSISLWSRRTSAIILGLFIITAIAVPALPAHAATTLSVQAPSDGDVLTADGSSYEVRWRTSANVSGTFEYFLIPEDDTPVLPPPPPGGSSIAYIESFEGYNPGGKVVSIAATSHSGTLSLDPDVPEGTYTLRIYATHGGLLSKPSAALFVGESDPFTIKSVRPSIASVELVTPNGEETWVSGTPQILRFRSSGVASLQLAVQNLTTGQPCTIATNIDARVRSWMIIPVIGMPCRSSATQRLTAGNYRAALYDNNWSVTRASAYSEAPFSIAATSPTKISDIERLEELVELLSEILSALLAARS
jgi:hypothetical protein